ncbi:hypothetical protein BP422_15505 [Brevibacillus formosus]|uniref:Uncharacterized protein n=1 Tax=Brevibacillus formosus TaxID=54913 RepID=A0A220MIH6_9BACL|nr:DUF5626 family protein [Brevibacillus formosus]ASJ54847.1 hypothetical protein BP422_15505 [Brevibacillus formosus]
MKKLASVMSVFALTLGIFTQSIFAEETSSASKLSQAYVAQLKNSFSELGIDEKTQNALIKKLENGQILDSMKEENIQKTINKRSFNIEKGLNQSEVVTFADGSKIKYGVRPVNSGIKSVAPGSYTVESYWATGTVNYSYYNDYTIVKGINNDFISKAYNPTVAVIGGTFTTPTVTIHRAKETSSKYAYSQMDFTYTFSLPLPPVSATAKLYFNVGNDDYDTTLSLSDTK